MSSKFNRRRKEKVGVFETLRNTFLVELAACMSRSAANTLAGAMHINSDCPGAKLVSYMVAIANVEQRPIEGRWVFHHEIRAAREVCAQIFTKGETRVIWLEPETGYYIEFELNTMPVRR